MTSILDRFPRLNKYPKRFIGRLIGCHESLLSVKSSKDKSYYDSSALNAVVNLEGFDPYNHLLKVIKEEGSQLNAANRLGLAYGTVSRVYLKRVSIKGSIDMLYKDWKKHGGN